MNQIMKPAGNILKAVLLLAALAAATYGLFQHSKTWGELEGVFKAGAFFMLASGIAFAIFIGKALAKDWPIGK